jgi:hypothetical protein
MAGKPRGSGEEAGRATKHNLRSRSSLREAPLFLIVSSCVWLLNQSIVPTLRPAAQRKMRGWEVDPGFLVRMSGRWFAVLLLLIARSACAQSWHDDSHYVALGPRTGYYIVRPGSALSHQLGIEGAPTSDTADPFRHGYGADALAFRFNKAGVLSAPPAYIVQATPSAFYTRRLGSLIRGRSTCRDVEAFFGRAQSTENRRDGVIAYYAIEVYNPSEDRSGHGRR